MPNFFYCKYCGKRSGSLAALTCGSCSNSPSKKHELYEGSEKSSYLCKYCGKRSGSIATLTVGSCPRSPHKRHEPAL